MVEKSKSVPKMIRVAFGSVPKDGGTFTFFRNLRPLLLKHGIELICVSIGKHQANITDTSFVTEGCVQLASDSTRLKFQAKAFEEWVRAENIDIVFGVNSPAILSAIPHLPAATRILARCANGFDEGYRLTLIGGDRLMRIVALTPRLKTDLVGQYNVSPDNIILIPNGADRNRFNPALRTRSQTDPLQLSFLGRLEHNQKGVLHLPPILAELDRRGVDYHLKIAGRGKDEQKLREGLESQSNAAKVEFVGALSPNEIPEFLNQSDIYLFPSHFEGCPNALLEAMMAGAVPVAWHLEGITDFLIKDEVTGSLVRTGDTEAFATKIEHLAENRDTLLRMRELLVQDTRDRFSTDRCAASYVDFFEQIMDEAPPVIAARLWSEFKPDPMLQERFINRIIPPKSRATLKTLASRVKRGFVGRSHA